MFLKEVYADGLLIISGKNALTVTLNHARFTNSAIAYNHHLKHNKKRKISFDTILNIIILFFSWITSWDAHCWFSHTFLLHHWTDLWEIILLVLLDLQGVPNILGHPLSSLKSWLKITIQDSLIICWKTLGWKIPHWSGIERKLQHNVRRWYMMKTVI